MGEYFDMSVNLAEETLEELKRTDLGIWGFENVTDDLRCIRILLESADKVGDKWIPNEQRGAINSNFSALMDQVRRIREFNKATGDPGTINTQIQNAILRLKDDLIKSISPYLRIDLEDIARTRTEIESQMSSLTQMKSDFEEMKADWNARQDAERLANAESGTSESSAFFEGRALIHEKLAKSFGIWTIVLTLGLVIWTLLESFTWFRFKWDSKDVIGSLFSNFPHVVLIGLVTFAIGLLLRNYRVNQHLSVLNRTKATTLKAGESFVKSFKDPSSRDIVLETMVKSAFALGETGYLLGEQERPVIESPNLSSIIHAVQGSSGTKS